MFHRILKVLAHPNYYHPYCLRYCISWPKKIKPNPLIRDRTLHIWTAYRKTLENDPLLYRAYQSFHNLYFYVQTLCKILIQMDIFKKIDIIINQLMGKLVFYKYESSMYKFRLYYNNISVKNQDSFRWLGSQFR